MFPLSLKEERHRLPAILHLVHDHLMFRENLLAWLSRFLSSGFHSRLLMLALCLDLVERCRLFLH